MLKRKCNEARWDYLRDLANNMHDKKEYKLFWNYVNSKRRGLNDLTVIKLDNGNTLTDESDISECMNKIFASVFTRGNTENILQHSHRSLQMIASVFSTVQLMKLRSCLKI